MIKNKFNTDLQKNICNDKLPITIIIDTKVGDRTDNSKDVVKKLLGRL